MKICPIALAVGCRKCPIFAICPAKGIIGDYRKQDDEPVKAAASASRPKARSARKARSTRKAKSRR
jgi:hypothetical protein